VFCGGEGVLETLKKFARQHTGKNAALVAVKNANQ
jgi:hypothetical protein